MGAGNTIDRCLAELEPVTTGGHYDLGPSSLEQGDSDEELVGVGVVLVLVLVGSSAAWANTSGPQSFTVIQLNEQQGRVFAGGPIAGAGVDVIEREEEGDDGTVHFVETFVLGRGNVTVGGTGTASGEFDERTCIGRRHLSGSVLLLDRPVVHAMAEELMTTETLEGETLAALLLGVVPPADTGLWSELASILPAPSGIARTDLAALAS